MMHSTEAYTHKRSEANGDKYIFKTDNEINERRQYVFMCSQVETDYLVSL